MATPTQVLDAFWRKPLRPESFTNKREALLCAGMRLFHRQGVSATGINQILELAQMGKSQFYHYFRDKDDFVAGVLQHEMDLFLNKVAPDITQLRCLEDFNRWFEPYLALGQLPDHMGCPVGVIASEVSPGNAQLRAVAAECLSQWIDRIELGLRQLARQLKFQDHFQPDSAAQYMASAIQGALLLGRTMGSDAPIYLIREQLRGYLQSFGRNCTEKYKAGQNEAPSPAHP